MKLSIRLKLLIGFILLVLLSALVQGFAFVITRDYIADQIESVQKTEVEKGANEINDFFDRLTNNSLGLAKVYSTAKYNFVPASTYLISNNNYIKRITVLSPLGKELEKINTFGPLSQNKLTYEVFSDPFKTAVAGKTALSKVYYIEDGLGPHIDLFSPIINQKGIIEGVIKLQVNLSQLRDELADIRLGENGYIYLVDDEGRLIAHASEAYVLERPNLSTRQIVSKTLANEEITSSEESYINEKNITVVSKAAKISDLNWVAVFEQPKTEAYGFLTIIRNIFIITIIGAIVLLFLIAYYLSENLTRPIRKLQISAQQIEAGKIEKTEEIKSGDEIESLSKSFSHLIDQLIQREHWLERTTGQLQDANARLKELDILKNEFVSVASHELRTPMTAIKSYLWMALDGKGGPLTEKQRYYIDRAYLSVDRLVKMVNDMLNISRIESGRLTINMQAISIEKLVQEVVEDVKPRSDELGVTVTMKMDAPPPGVLGDPDKLKEVLFNLIGNSLKFTPKGGTITVTFSQYDNMVEVKVTDTGSGIEAEDLPKLFQKFGLLPGSYVTNQAALGTGLGLYICKSIIELHEGKIWAKSPGRAKGSEFAFNLKVFNEADLQRLSAKYMHESGNAVELIHSQV